MLGAQQRPVDSTGRVLKALEQAIGDANVRRDKAFFERVEAEEFIFTGSGGAVSTRKEDLAELETPATATLLSYVADSMIVRRYRETAVVWGRATTTTRLKDGSTVTRRSRFTDVFIWRDTRWQLVAGHSSAIR